jgi:hypothetical protein
VNTANVAGTVVYHITPHFIAGCDGATVDFVVTVKPLPSADATDLTICSGETASIAILGSPKNVIGTTFSWTAVENNADGAAIGNGSTILQTLVSTLPATPGTVAYTITPTANGCNGPQEVVVATVNPAVSVNAGVDYEVCEDVTAPMPISLTGTIGGSATSGTWIKKTGFGAISGNATSGQTVTAMFTATQADIDAGFIEVYLETNDPDVGGPCAKKADTVKIQINKRPRLVPLIDQMVCEPAQIDLKGQLAGSATSGSWSIVSAGPGGTLSVSSVNGLGEVSAKYDTVSADVGQTLVFRLTTIDTDGSGPCIAAIDDVIVKINESAKVNAGLDFAVCEDEVVNLQGSFTGSATSATWTGGGGAFSNAADPLSTYTLTPANIAAKQVVLTLTSNDPDGIGLGAPCGPAVDQVVIQVNPLPNASFTGLLGAYAENSDGSNLLPLNTNPGTSIFTGPGMVSGSNRFEPAIAATSGYGLKTIRHTFTSTETGCDNFTEQTTIVNQITSIDFEFAAGEEAGLLLTICENTTAGQAAPKYYNEIIAFPLASTGRPLTVIRSDDPIIQSRIALLDGKYYLNTYKLPTGNYTMEYVYTNLANAESRKTKTIHVNAAPKAVIAIDKACVDNSNIVFMDNSFMPNPAVDTTYHWDYGNGNGNTNGQRNPTDSYLVSGTYVLKLEVVTNLGCAHDTVGTITVGKPPKVDFSATKLCSGDNTTFTDQSTTFLNNIIAYSWDFDDGDTLGFGMKDKVVLPPYNHGGKTSGTYTHPEHTYNNFRVYNVKLNVLTDDGCTSDTTKRIYILDYSVPIPTNAYVEDFENGPGTWVKADLLNNSWVFGAPTGSVINSANDNAWWTGENINKDVDNSTYYKNEKSEVIGPCLDISSLERPMISLNYWSDLQEGFDGVVVQYSLDAGATWETIGNAEGGGIEWYNARNLPGQPGGQSNYAWSDEDETKQWRNARFNLDQIPLNQRDKLVFKIAFGSNNDNLPGKVLNGFAFDDIYIGEKTKTVLVEQFLNYTVDPQSDFAGESMNNKYDAQIATDITGPGKLETDFFKVEYHVAVAGAQEDLNLANKVDPFSRAFLYGISSPPITIMDGIRDNGIFNGDHANIDAEELDRRALEDPKFMIDIDTVDTGNNTTLSLNATFDYVDSISSPFNAGLLFQVLLVENDVPVSGRGTYRNVVRKMLLPGQGQSINQVWDFGTGAPTAQNRVVIPVNYVVDVPIANEDNLYLVAYVQDDDAEGPKATRIYQSKIVKGPEKRGRTIVGVDEDPALAEIQHIAVYPNPVSKTLKLQLDEKLSRAYVWKLIDQRGITVKSGEVNRNLSVPQEIDVEDLANGMYFLEIGLPDRKLMHKKIAVMNRN